MLGFVPILLTKELISWKSADELKKLACFVSKIHFRKGSTQLFLPRSKSFIFSFKTDDERMEKLLGAYLDSDVPKEMYLKRKDTLMRSTSVLKEKLKDFERGRNNWVEPLRKWILDTKQANFLSSSADFHEISSFVKRIGTNPLVRDKSARFELRAPSHYIAQRLAFFTLPAPTAHVHSGLTSEEVSFCGE